MYMITFFCTRHVRLKALSLFWKETPFVEVSEQEEHFFDLYRGACSHIDAAAEKLHDYERQLTKGQRPNKHRDPLSGYTAL